MVESEDKGTVRIYRFDPTRDNDPRYDTYTDIPYKESTVLDVLRYIQENVDSTLAFRWACTRAFCRSCAMIVNGKPALACILTAEREMTIEPHKKFPVIKDLIVDLEKRTNPR